MKENPKSITKQIKAQLLKGKEPKEIISKGFSKSTVYKTRKKLAQTAINDIQGTIGFTVGLSQYLCVYYNKDVDRCEYQKLDHPPLCPFCPYKKIKTLKELGLE